MTAKSTITQTQPTEVWKQFLALTGIPRQSGNEQAARDFCTKVASAKNASWAQDQSGNILILKEGAKDKPAVIIQGHLDMVCVSQGSHDFATKPITTIIEDQVEGKIMKASGTTLGADNGVGVAMGLALLDNHNPNQGDIILLLTSREEDGDWSANHINVAKLVACSSPAAGKLIASALLNARYLINLDSENRHEITIGSAGGQTYKFSIGLQTQHIRGNGISIHVSGLRGGHSGTEIVHRQNAIKILAELLIKANLPKDTYLTLLQAGQADNAIPPEALAQIHIPEADLQAAMSRLRTEANSIIANAQPSEPNITIEITESSANGPGTPIQIPLDLISTLPHGAIRESLEYPNVVDTSTNLAKVTLDENGLSITVSTRSLTQKGVDWIGQKCVDKVFQICPQADVPTLYVTYDQYPAWTPKSNGTLLKLTQHAFRKVTLKTPTIVILHAGLECGSILKAMPHLEAVSFGPLITGAHTTSEAVNIDSVKETWDILLALLTEITKT